jgi:uncharacterized protein
MALTCYLAVPVIGIAIFQLRGYYQRVPALAGTIIGIVVFLAMLGTAHWWFGQFRMGPVEWLWRSITAGRRQLMRQVSEYTGILAGRPALGQRSPS